MVKEVRFYAWAGPSRPTQTICSPRLSIEGSTPKVLYRNCDQLKGDGLGRFFCLSSRNRRESMLFKRGESSPK
jgi:hypothetical protein